MTTPGPPPQQPEQPGNPAGQPPSPPDQPAPYGAPNPYGAPGHPPQYGVPAPPPGGYAQWGDRAIATLWDLVYLWPALAAFGAAALVMAVGVGIGSATESDGVIVVAMILGGLLLLASWILLLWRHIRNYMLDQGRTGYTYGKRKVGIRTIREDTHQPAGVASCVGRYFLHGIINQLVYIDYLWPLWDDKNQTLTDKVLTTIVVRQPDQAPR